MKSFLSVACAVLITAAPGLAQTTNRPATASADCYDGDALSAQIRVIPPENRAAEIGLDWETDFDSGARLAAAYQLASPCSARIANFVWFGLAMDNGQTYGLINESALVYGQERVLKSVGPPRPTYRNPYFDLADVKDIPSPVVDGVFVTAIHITFVREPPGAHGLLGVWRTPSGSVLAAFTWAKGEAPSAPRIVATSAAQIRNIAFFPSPDSPGGGLSILQGTDGRADMIALSIWHQRWYLPKPASKP